MTRDETAPLNLDLLLIPGLIVPVQTEGADGGVNHGMLNIHEKGLLVQVQPYLNMQEGDWIEVFWGDPGSPVAYDRVLEEHVGDRFGLYISADLIPDGISDVWARVTRSGSGNSEDSPPLAVLVRTLVPGGTDPEPDLPGHQNLPAPEPELPPSGVIDEEAARNGIKVTIGSYPNMRVFDTITFSWGGVLLQHEVTQDEVNAGSLEILVTEDVILEAGDSNELVLVYRVRDEVHNPSSEWSIRTMVHVEVGKGLFGAPQIENPNPDAEPYDVIDLDLLGDDDLLVNVLAAEGGALIIGDVVALKWIGTTAQGQPIVFEPEPQSVPRIPTVVTFLIPNADVRQLGRGRGVASYSVTRDGIAAGVSKRSFATFLGEEQRLPKPTVPDAVNGVLDPALDGTTVVVPGEVLEAGDYVWLVWLGTRANGSPLLHEDERPVSGSGTGKPMTFTIPATAIAPLDGGNLSVYYRLSKNGGVSLESERERLTVGEARDELPAPTTRPAAEGGVLDPADLPAQLAIVIPPWPDMHVDQTLHVLWRASSGPHYDDFIPISAPMLGKEVVFYLEREHVETNLGAKIEITYRVESPGEADQVSALASFLVDTQEEIESGPLRIMGARFNASIYQATRAARMLTALHDDSLAPMLVEWRYEDSQQWTAGTTWIDTKPWLKLYVRSASESWECRAANIIGNGAYSDSTQGLAAFIAMRDEVMGENGLEVDMVGWGNSEYGAWLGELADVKNVVEISASAHAFAARLHDGNVICWGNEFSGGSPPMVAGDFVQVRSTQQAFAARKRDGGLFAWGHEDFGAHIPTPILQHKDYVEICGATRAFGARRASGHVVAWGNPDLGGQLRLGQEAFDDVTQLFSNQGAFIALRERNGTKNVFTWGHLNSGGLIPDDIARLTNVRAICASTHNAFCILLDSGEIKAWPATSESGVIPDTIARLTNVVEVTATGHAFCARLSTGQVVAWGDPERGGKLTDAAAGKSNIVQVVGNALSFAALCSDGTVVAWGEKRTGGDTSSVDEQLVDVRAIYGNTNAFAALTKDGRVVTWGLPNGGGNSNGVQPQLRGKVTASRLLPPDEARAVAEPNLRPESNG
ncbi:RCC1 domain-containing protein [Pseudomonas japonica]|uniref:RCC1 domain-containing protein n=1 Tax=Pseudomonas japonica TaxID=256466 RepID=UPI0037F60A32